MQPLRRDQISDAVALLVRAFDEDPYFRFVAPEAAERAFLTGEVMRTNVELAIPRNAARAIVEGETLQGILLWFEPGAYPPPTHEVIGVRARAIARTLAHWARERRAQLGVLLDALRMSALIDEAHPAEPYYYLQVLAVDTPLHGRGLGSRMLRVATAEADAAGRVAMIETSKPANLRLYERFGFEVVRASRLSGSPPVWTMRREPR